MLKLALTKPELELLEDIEEIGYGELYDVSRPAGPPFRIIELSERSHNFIKGLREQDSFKKVSIHDSEPVSAEYESLTGHNRRCLKRIRF